MALPKKTWPKAATARRDRILAAALARGVTHRALGEAAGLKGKGGEVRVSRWVRGIGPPLSDEQLDAMERSMSAVPAGEPGAPSEVEGVRQLTAQEIARTVGELAALAAEIPEGEKEELRFLARQQPRAIFGGMLRLALGAKSEHARLAALQELKEWGWGKATQPVVDLTPKPPADAEDLIAKLEGLLAAPAPQPESDNAGTPEPS